MSVKDIVLAAAGVSTGAEKDPYFSNTVLLLQGDAASPSLTYNVFSDSSGVSNVTPFGDTYGSSFSPYNTSWGIELGSNNYLSVPQFNLGNGSFTIECWIRTTTKVQYQSVIGSYSGGATGFYLHTDANGYALFGTLGSVQVQGTTQVCDGLWHHIAVVRNGSSSVTLYVDGVSSGTGTISDNGAASNPVYIGTLQPGVFDRYFQGTISNIHVNVGSALYTSNFTRPSTDTVGVANSVLLTGRYNRFIDPVGSKAITTYGNVRVTSTSPFLDSDTTTGAGVFDKSGDYLVANSPSVSSIGTGDYSVEMWCYPRSFDLSSLFQRLWSFGTGLSNDVTLNIDTSGNLVHRINDVVLLTSSSPLTKNSWNHVALTRASGTLRMFINGVAVGSTSNSTNISTQGSSPLYIGVEAGATNSPGSNGDFDGFIADLRVVKGTATRTAAYTPPTSPLSVVGGTSLLSMQTRGAARNIGFLDDSEFNHVVTKIGNCPQGSFSPFSQEAGKWSIFKDGDSRITTPNISGYQFGTGDFCVEAFVFVPSGPATDYITNSWGIITQCADNGSWNNGWTLATNDASGSLTIVWYENNTTPVTASLPRNKWVHVAVTRSGTTIRMFIDGVLANSSTSSYNYAPSRVLSIGGESTGSSYQFRNSYISNLRVVKGSAIYTSGFTVPSSPLTAVSGTSLLTNGFNRHYDLSAPSKSFTASGNVSVQPFSPFAPSAAYDPSVNGGSVYLDGGGDELTIPDNDRAFWFGTNNFTVEAWVYPLADGITNGDPIFNQSTGNAASDSAVYFSLKGEGGGLYLSDGTGWDYFTSNTSLSLKNQWNHVAWVRNGTTLLLLINGLVAGSTTVPAGFSVGNSSRDIEIGSQNNSSYFNGYISGLRVVSGRAVYTGAYTVPTAPPAKDQDAALLLNFTNAGVVDSTGRNNIETVGNAIVSTSSKKFGNASLSFDGSTGAAVLPWSDLWLIGSGDYTVECWLNTTDTVGEIVSAFNETAPFPGWLFGVGFVNSDGKLYFYHGNSSVSETKGSVGAVNNGSWRYVAVSKSGNTLRFYIDGALDSTHSLALASTGSNQRIYVGRDANTSPGRYLGASIDDLRITKGVARYTGSSHTVPTKSLPNQ